MPLDICQAIQQVPINFKRLKSYVTFYDHNAIKLENNKNKIARKPPNTHNTSKPTYGFKHKSRKNKKNIEQSLHKG